jgi:hypothetical protein
MNTSRVTSEYRAAQWMQILQERQTSGYTIKDFCKDRGISRDAYFYWQHKLRNAVCNGLSKTGEIQTAAPRGWLQLSDANETKPTLEIDISGCRITVDLKTDPELLKNVCRILRTMG